MNTSRFLMGALVLCALPALAQPEIKPGDIPPYPIIPPEEAARLIETKPIKLDVRDVTVKDALEEVEKQTGISIETRFTGGDILTKKLSLDIETNSFREATAAIFDEAGVKATLQKFGRGSSWTIYQGDDPRQNKDAPVSGSGPFQIRLQSISTSLNKSVQLGKTPVRNQSASLNTTLTFDTDPQIPLVGTPRLEMTRVEDNQGRSLLIQERMPFFDGDMNIPAQVRLRIPEKDAREIAHLEGKATYTLAAKKSHGRCPTY